MYLFSFNHNNKCGIQHSHIWIPSSSEQARLDIADRYPNLGRHELP